MGLMLQAEEMAVDCLEIRECPPKALPQVEVALKIMEEPLAVVTIPLLLAPLAMAAEPLPITTPAVAVVGTVEEPELRMLVGEADLLTLVVLPEAVLKQGAAMGMDK